MNALIEIVFKVLFLLSLCVWVGSCGLGIYKDQDNLMALGAFAFFINMTASYMIGSSEK